jgi:hypothetical protein
MVPGTYTTPGGFRGYYDQPGLVVQDWVDYAFDDGGTFTVNSIDPTSPWGLQFDTWKRRCAADDEQIPVAFNAFLCIPVRNTNKIASIASLSGTRGR